MALKGSASSRTSKKKTIFSTLAGHFLIECSTLIDNILSTLGANRLQAVVTGKQKQEVGLVLPAEFTCITKKRLKKSLSNIIYQELLKKKEKNSDHLKLRL